LGAVGAMGIEPFGGITTPGIGIPGFATGLGDVGVGAVPPVLGTGTNAGTAAGTNPVGIGVGAGVGANTGAGAGAGAGANTGAGAGAGAGANTGAGAGAGAGVAITSPRFISLNYKLQIFNRNYPIEI